MKLCIKFLKIIWNLRFFLNLKNWHPYLSVEPAKNEILLDNGESVSYDALVLATGLELGFDQVDGLDEALEKDDRVCSNYSPKE